MVVFFIVSGVVILMFVVIVIGVIVKMLCCYLDVCKFYVCVVVWVVDVDFGCGELCGVCV